MPSQNNEISISGSYTVEESEVSAGNQDSPLIGTAREVNRKLIMPKE